MPELTLVVVDGVEVVEDDDANDEPHRSGHHVDGIVDEVGLQFRQLSHHVQAEQHGGHCKWSIEHRHTYIGHSCSSYIA